MIDQARIIDFDTKVLIPGLTFLSNVGGPAPSFLAATFLRAVAMQESSLKYRAQLNGGPARGWWQFEQSGVSGVMSNPVTKDLMRTVCDKTGTPYAVYDVWAALAWNDLLSTSVARLLLWTDPFPLPATEVDGWSCYLRLWRPGKPRPLDWSQNWKLSFDIFYALKGGDSTSS